MAADVVKIRKPKKAVEETKVPKTKSKTVKGATDEGKKNKGNRYIGKVSGLKVLDFQNKSLEKNRREKQSDEQVAKAWREEFPMAKAYTAEDVAGVRNAYNKGKHGNDLPDKPIPQFDDNGEAMPFWGEKSQAKKDAAAQKSAGKKAAKVKPSKKVADEEEEEEEEEDTDEEEEVEEEPAPKKKRRVVR